jgi:transcriptional regulator with XRE-family HTH domain
MGKYDPAPTVAAGLIRTARDRANLTQSQLAQLAGVTQQTVSAYETGRKEPTLPTLQRLLAAAGFELRLRLEPIDRHDQALQAFLDSLPAKDRVGLEQERRARAAAARRRRVKGR